MGLSNPGINTTTSGRLQYYMRHISGYGRHYDVVLRRGYEVVCSSARAAGGDLTSVRHVGCYTFRLQVFATVVLRFPSLWWWGPGRIWLGVNLDWLVSWLVGVEFNSPLDTT